MVTGHLQLSNWYVLGIHWVKSPEFMLNFTPVTNKDLSKMVDII